LLDLNTGFSKFDVQSAGEEGPTALEIYATYVVQVRHDYSKTVSNEAFSLSFSVQQLNLHKNSHISFLLEKKSEIL
jgi:hypothetical protein